MFELVFLVVLYREDRRSKPRAARTTGSLVRLSGRTRTPCQHRSCMRRAPRRDHRHPLRTALTDLLCWRQTPSGCVSGVGVGARGACSDGRDLKRDCVKKNAINETPTHAGTHARALWRGSWRSAAASATPPPRASGSTLQAAAVEFVLCRIFRAECRRGVTTRPSCFIQCFAKTAARSPRRSS